MTERIFQKLVKSDTYQVFLFQTPAPMPFSFLVHTYFVINRKGSIERWEFALRDDLFPKNGFGIHKNFLRPTEGMIMYPFISKKRFSAKLVGFVEGDEESLAHKMATFISEKTNEYPYKEIYKYLGPNSNTYTQWILNQFKDTSLRLSRRAVGKGYHKGAYLH